MMYLYLKLSNFDKCLINKCLKKIFLIDVNKSNGDTKRDTHDIALMKQDSGTSENVVRMYFFLFR